MNKRILFIVIALLSLSGLMAQNEIDPNGFNVFYYPNGVKSSEGNMRDGKPDGYWKTYNDKGILVSEGNRENFLLDSLWKFYSDSGIVILEVNYKRDLKNGVRRTYHVDEIIEENFRNNVKHGDYQIFYKNGKLKRKSRFENGYEDGVAKEYDSVGLVISQLTYKKGYLTDREYINRYDRNGKQHGKWKWFYESGELMKEAMYKHGILDGYTKDYTIQGDLALIRKFEDGEEILDAPELQKLEIKTDYYDNGSIKTVASYKNGLPEGVRREYDSLGNITASYIFKEGTIIGEGIIDEEGIKDGEWEEHYDNGQLRSKGKYLKGKKNGFWSYFHKNGQLEQQGEYNEKGNTEGSWTWYYDNGNVWREASYFDGMLDGHTIEYDIEGNVIAEGDYIEDLEEGNWKVVYNDHIEEGKYRGGQMFGAWKFYNPEGKLTFEGSFIDGNPNGRHTWYWINGKKKEQGAYSMGRKKGTWVKYNLDGTPFLMITYRNGREVKYDGIEVKPSF